MRLKIVLGLIGLAGVGVASYACSSAPGDVCDIPGVCTLDGSSDVKPGDTGADAPPVSCPSGKEPKDDPTCVTNDLGIFVSATGSDGNAGTKEKPLATLGAALTKASGAGKGKIFVCEGSYTESVEIKSTVGVYGGFKCADWSYSGTKPKFAGAKPDYVVKVDGASGVTLADLELDGKDGAPNSGESSIGLVCIASDVSAARLILAAGLGSVGKPGVLTAFTFTVPPNGGDASGATGGVAATHSCPAGDSSIGGKGGNGTLNAQFNQGGSGTPALDGGAGGAGGSTCTNGGDGLGADLPKAALGAQILGTIVGSWVPSKGADGSPGKPGQGGGGGGGRDTGALQGGGAGGGTGGCGGAGGGGGGGGGGSVALLAVDSPVKLSLTDLSSKAGGNGGDGKAGQAGQSQIGAGGTAVSPGCSGGIGGVGGAGGAGGGGAGGISVGILYKGTKPTTDAVTDGKITVGTKGTKGLGGASPTNDGIDGVAQAVLQVP